MAPSRDSARVAPGPQRIIDGDEGFSTIPYCRNSIGRTHWQNIRKCHSPQSETTFGCRQASPTQYPQG